MPTLYISDLDGTLLRSDQKISLFTAQTVNRLVQDGLYFSFATARSVITAVKATAGLHVNIPMVVYNGAFIMESESRHILTSNFFTAEDSVRILNELLCAGVFPVVYSLEGEREQFRYHTTKSSTPLLDFVNSRKGDPRATPVAKDSMLFSKDIFYFTCIDNIEKLEPLYQKLRTEFRCIYHNDIYSGEQWLEIMPENVGKAAAAGQLARHIGCDRIVAFGDARNDLDLFGVADECYAVANAVPELKKIATGVIGSNDEDGVAKWLLENRASLF